MTSGGVDAELPGIDDVRAAAKRIAPFARVTPVMTSASLDALAGARVHVKCEHLQRTGSFKFRGATNAVFALDDVTAARGVAAHSSGNHAQALALAASLRGIPCHVVMPENAPRTKKDATRTYGARLAFCEPTLEAREVGLRRVLDETGATEIHPYDNPLVMAGQGTAALELLAEVPRLSAVITPVSGGGLLSGTAIAAHAAGPDVQVWGAEPSNVDDAHRSLLAGRLIHEGNSTSIADGLLAMLCPRTFAVLQKHGVAVVTVTEDEIVGAMELVFSRLKQVVEPSASTAIAGLLALCRSGTRLGPDVGVILSGGNVDLDDLPFGGTR